MSRMILTAITILLAVVIIAVWVGTRRQQGALFADVDRLIHQGTLESGATPYSPEALNAVPAIVSQYLRRALGNRRHIQEIRMKQSGMLRTDVRSERWVQFEAEHVVIPPATGFVWNARVGIAPLLHVRVRDALIEGRGAGHVSLLSAFTVGSDAGTPEMNSGSLHRYLAEAVCYPTALLPGPKLQWTGIDATRALATLTDHGISVSLEFRFSEDGQVIGIYTPGRWGKFAEGYRQAPWEGHFRSYEERHGVLVPTEGEVGWYVDGSYQPVWKGTISAFRLRPDVGELPTVGAPDAHGTHSQSIRQGRRE